MLNRLFLISRKMTFVIKTEIIDSYVNTYGRYTVIMLLAIAMFSVDPRGTRADDLDEIQSAVQSGSCPANTAKRSLVFGSCSAEAAGLKMSNSNDVYNEFMRCNDRENKLNRAINAYNSLMYSCESKKQEQERAEKEKQRQAEAEKQKHEAAEKQRAQAAEKARNEAKAKADNNGNVNKQPSDIDRRLQQARTKAETLGRESKAETESMVREAVQGNERFKALQAERAEQERRRRDELARARPKLICFGENGGSVRAGYRMCQSACVNYHSASRCEDMCYNAGSSQQDGRSCFYDK